MPAANATERRRVGTRRLEIQAAAIALFAKEGYSGTSMEGIAAAVGLVPASLYNHWPSKQNILADIIVTYETEMLDTFVEAVRNHGTVREALHAASTARIRYLLQHGRQAAITDRDKLSLDQESLTKVEVLQNTHFTQLRSLIIEGQTRGEFNDGIDALIATVALLEMGTRFATSFLHQSEYPSWIETPDMGTVLQTRDGRTIVTLDTAADQYGSMALRMLS